MDVQTHERSHIFTKVKTSSTYLARFHLFSLLFPGSPHFLLLCHAKSCRCTGSGSVSSAGAECRMRIQVAMRGKKKTPDVDMFKSSEKSYNKGGSALLNSQSPNNVSPLAVIHNAFFFPFLYLSYFLLSKAVFFKYFFFVAGVNCQALPL